MFSGTSFPMLRPANVVDLPIFARAHPRRGAVGRFRPDLATESRDAAMFFNNLRQALATGIFRRARSTYGDLATAAVLAYVYLQDDDPTMHRPIGFGVFKAASVGYELWLTGIDAAWRGKAHEHKMLAALLETTALVARLPRPREALRSGKPGDGTPPLDPLVTALSARPRSSRCTCAVTRPMRCASCHAPPKQQSELKRSPPRGGRPRSVPPKAVQHGRVTVAVIPFRRAGTVMDELTPPVTAVSSRAPLQCPSGRGSVWWSEGWRLFAAAPRPGSGSR
jgi:hypothetical protein